MAGVELGGLYLEVVLRLRGLVPGWVEGYVGPRSLADAIDAGGEVSVEGLRESAEELGQRVASEEQKADRRVWLLAQLHWCFRSELTTRRSPSRWRPWKLNCARYATSARRRPAASRDRITGAPAGRWSARLYLSEKVVARGSLKLSSRRP